VPKMIADNYQFRDLTEVWLGGDHYKWRAMRGNGVLEEYITGNRDSYEKFEKWAQQFHIGAIRDNNTRMFNILGPDTGYDAIHDVQCAAAPRR